MKVVHVPKCTLCNVTFETKEELIKHVSDKHNPTDKHQCEQCMVDCDSKQELEKHIQHTHPFNCKECFIHLNSGKELEDHMLKEHCPSLNRQMCSLVFDDQSSQTNQCKESHGETVVCSVCEEKFFTKIELMKHMESEHYSECRTCGLRFKTSSQLKDHASECTVKSGNSTRYNCSQCKVDCDSMSELEKHIQQLHDTSSRCQACNLVFKDQSSLEDHLKVSHAEVVECLICEVTLKTKNELVKHMETEHYSECTTCGKKFKTCSQLKEHTTMCSIHPCDLCSVIYYDEPDLKNHKLKVHNKVCNYCKKVFNSQGDLDDHKANAHNYKCNQCETSKTTEDALNEHMRNCHNDKCGETVKYQCEQCDFEGDSLAVIIEHVILSHKKDKGGKFECEGCPIVVDTRRELVEHYNNEHLLDSDLITIESDPEENVMIEQYRLLKSSFERLSNMLKATQEEAAQTKMFLTTQLNEATERYSALLAENEELKEKNDLLYKLGKGYLEMSKKLEIVDLSADPNEIQIVGQKTGVSNQENVETGWKKQSLRGFRKVKFSKESVQDGMKPADNTDQMNALDNPVNRNLLKIAGYPNNHPARTDLFIP